MSITFLTSQHAYYFRTFGKAFLTGASATVSWNEYLDQATRFDTKEEYLAWRSAWKLEYAALTQESRQAKRGHKLAEDAEPYFEGRPRSVKHLKNIAFLMLMQRVYSKQKAQEQYTLAKLNV